MLKYQEDEWAKIVQRMVTAELIGIPNGRFVDSVLDGNKCLSYLIEFNTPTDEMMFVLRWT